MGYVSLLHFSVESRKHLCSLSVHDLVPLVVGHFLFCNDHTLWFVI